ncbi:MAG TPA: ATP-binding protein [Salinarimonas sp.]|nr:ATP-binding protein [Salinarimonas sp.]
MKMDTTRLPSSPGRDRRALLPYMGLIVGSLLLPVLIFTVAAWQNWGQLVTAAEDRAQKRAILAAEHALKVFQSNEQVLRRVDDRVRGLDWDAISSSAELNAFLTELPTEVDHLQGAGLIRPDGRLANVGAAFPTPPTSLADRDYFLGARQSPGRTFISTPVVGRISGQPFFRLARQRAGEGEGVIFVSLSPEYFARFYRSITGGEDAVTMVRRDGAVLVREPAITTGVDVLNPSSGFMRGIARAEQGTYRLVSQLDGIERVHAYQRVGTYPVYVSYGYSLRAIGREWLANLLTFGIVTGLASLALLALSLLAMRRARREQMVFADFRAEVARREEAEARLRQSQKMEAVGQLTGGVAHDFNNLLTVVTGSLDMLRRRMEEAPARDLRLVENALEGARRAATLTHHLLAFSRQQPLDPKPLDPNRLVAGMSELLRRTLNEAIGIETVLAGGLWRAHADPNQLENAILNLAVNARDAMPDGGKLTIETANAALDETYAGSRTDVRAGQYVLVSVSDTGLGMPREVLERVFEPFFTTKPVGKGTGLGLAQVYGFMKQSGGHAAIYSEPGQGTTVKLYLPRYRGADEVVDRAEPGMEQPPPGSGETILVVEDDDMVRRFTVEALGEAGYRVLEAGDGPAGLRLLDADPRIALLFTDVVLAGQLNGRKLADEALRRRPDLRVVFTTGYTRNAIIHHGRLDEGVNFLGKPFTSSDLLHKVRTVLGKEGST